MKKPRGWSEIHRCNGDETDGDVSMSVVVTKLMETSSCL